MHDDMIVPEDEFKLLVQEASEIEAARRTRFVVKSLFLPVLLPIWAGIYILLTPFIVVKTATIWMTQY